MFALAWNPRLVVTGMVLLASCECGNSATSDYEIAPEPTGELAAPSEAERPEPEAVPEPPPGSDPDHERSLLAELLATVGDEDGDHGFDPNAPTPRTLADAIDNCDGEAPSGDYSSFRCQVQSVAALDSRGRFIGLVTDMDPGGEDVQVTLFQDDGHTQRALRTFDAFGAPLPAIRRRLGRHGSLAVLPNLISAHAYTIFSLDSYSPLVLLSGPLEGWVLWLETTGLEDREERLHLMRPDGSDDRVLGTRPSRVGSGEGEAWCEINNTDPEAECTEAMLEAEGKLVVLPTDVFYVTTSPSGHLLMIGDGINAGHGPHASTHWAVMLPDDLRP